MLSDRRYKRPAKYGNVQHPINSHIFRIFGTFVDCVAEHFKLLRGAFADACVTIDLESGRGRLCGSREELLGGVALVLGGAIRHQRLLEHASYLTFDGI